MGAGPATQRQHKSLRSTSPDSGTEAAHVDRGLVMRNAVGCGGAEFCAPLPITLWSNATNSRGEQSGACILQPAVGQQYPHGDVFVVRAE